MASVQFCFKGEFWKLMLVNVEIALNAFSLSNRDSLRFTVGTLDNKPSP